MADTGNSYLSINAFCFNDQLQLLAEDEFEPNAVKIGQKGNCMRLVKLSLLYL